MRLCCRDGRSRQLGFIGFKTEVQAVAAQRYYNKSYMDTFKLEVEVGVLGLREWNAVQGWGGTC